MFIHESGISEEAWNEYKETRYQWVSEMYPGAMTREQVYEELEESPYCLMQDEGISGLARSLWDNKFPDKPVPMYYDCPEESSISPFGDDAPIY